MFFLDLFDGRDDLIPLLEFFVLSSLFLFVIFKFFLFDRLNKIVKRIDPSFRGQPDFIHELDMTLDRWSKERNAEIERLKKLENYRKEFLGNVGHELKTPIFNIQGYIMTLLDGGLEDDKINRNYLQRAEKSVERMVTIVDDLEAITQLESGELELELERFDLVEMLHDVAMSQEYRAKSKSITIVINYYQDKKVIVHADKFRVRQVITNLVVNSIKYGKENGETTVRLNEVGEKIRVEVADNGIGIPGQHLPRLFERFYRVDKSRSREMGGTGLGLSIVKHILEAHGQSIHVMSTVGAGSVFSFTLDKG
jgi:two-component system, OmpR family, phosphate regulon sensor histidine kinase PhoR